MRMPGVAMPWLVGYYGVFQAGHVVFNVVYLSGLRPIPEFPWPPAEGWHPQATAFWTATGLIDTAIALLALYFVAAFFGGRRRALWAGLVSLATYMCTIFVFNYTVVATGAWAQHPVEYVVLNAATIPLVLLFAVVIRNVRAPAPRTRPGALWRSGACAPALRSRGRTRAARARSSWSCCASATRPDCADAVYSGP